MAQSRRHINSASALSQFEPQLSNDTILLLRHDMVDKTHKKNSGCLFSCITLPLTAPKIDLYVLRNVLRIDPKRQMPTITSDFTPQLSDEKPEESQRGNT